MIEFVTYRIAAWDTPLWSLPNRRAGRYNDADDGSTQYLGLHPMTPWAEVIRNEELTDPLDILNLRPPIWAIRVLLDDDPLELTFDNAGAYGLAPSDLVDDDQDACRALARGLRSDPSASHALIVPSAALPGTRNLVVLDPKVAIPYSLEPIDDQDIPVALIAEDGHAPVGLGTLIHHKGTGTKHAGLDAWDNGNELLLEEPATARLA